MSAGGEFQVQGGVASETTQKAVLAAVELLSAPIVASSVTVQGVDGQGDDGTGTNPVQVGGLDGSGNLQPLKVDTGGQLQIVVVTAALPAGASTEATLAAISAKLGSLGQNAMAGSAPVVIASDQSAVPISAASLPLPSTAATSTKQSDGSQKSQVVDGGGVVIGSNYGDAANALRVAAQLGNASAVADFGAGSIGAQTLRSNPGTAATATCTNVSDSASSVTLIAANTARLGLVLFNDSSAVCYVKFGTTASTSSFTHKMDAGSFWALDTVVYNGRIDAIWASAPGGAMRITELT